MYTIDQAANRLKMTKRSLRYYEEIGLLLPPERTEGNYRLYSEEDILRIERILRLKEGLGVSLSEIKDMVAYEDERLDLTHSFQSSQNTRDKIVFLRRGEELALQELEIIKRKKAALSNIEKATKRRLQRLQRLREKLEEDSPALQLHPLG